jgi:hypothetical protein
MIVQSFRDLVPGLTEMTLRHRALWFWIRGMNAQGKVAKWTWLRRATVPPRLTQNSMKPLNGYCKDSEELSLQREVDNSRCEKHYNSALNARIDSRAPPLQPPYATIPLIID